MSLNSQLEIATKNYFKAKNVVLVNGYVNAKDLSQVLGLTSLRKDFGTPECVKDGGTYKFPISCVPFIACNYMNRSVKNCCTRDALREYLDYIGLEYLNIWADTKFYILHHVDSNKVKIGITDTALEKRVHEVTRYWEGQTDVLLCHTDERDVDPINVEFDVKSKFSHLKSEPPSEVSGAPGKDEWYDYSEEIEDFIKNFNEYKTAKRQSVQKVKDLEIQKIELQKQIDRLKSEKGV